MIDRRYSRHEFCRKGHEAGFSNPILHGAVTEQCCHQAARANSGSGTVAMVSRIRLAILYGSPWELGRRSSRYPFQPFLGMLFGTRIDAPRSDTPKVNLSMDWVSCRPVRRRW